MKESLRKEKQKNKKLEKENRLKTAVIETIEEVNEILDSDEEAQKLLWTKGFPHNLKPEVAQKIQKALKKNPKLMGGSKF